MRDRDDTELVEEFRTHLLIDQHNLDSELVHQPTLYNEVAKALAHAESRRDQLSEKLKVVDAHLYTDWKTELEEAAGDGKRITDTAIANAIQQDSNHEKARSKYLSAKEEAAVLLAMKEAFYQRSYMLRDLASLFTTQYYERDVVHGGSKESKDIVYKRNKEKLREARADKKSAKEKKRARL